MASDSLRVQRRRPSIFRCERCPPFRLSALCLRRYSADQILGSSGMILRPIALFWGISRASPHSPRRIRLIHSRTRKEIGRHAERDTAQTSISSRERRRLAAVDLGGQNRSSILPSQTLPAAQGTSSGTNGHYQNGHPSSDGSLSPQSQKHRPPRRKHNLNFPPHRLNGRAYEALGVWRPGLRNRGTCLLDLTERCEVIPGGLPETHAGDISGTLLT